MKLTKHKKRPDATPGKKRGTWWTPPKLAAKVATWARVVGLRVVDLGAGRGALSVAAMLAGAGEVVAIERDRNHFRHLEQALEREGHDARAVLGDVFWCRDDQYDVALLNPPFEGDMPERFVMRALELAPRAVAIVPINVLTGKGRGRELWDRVVESREARLLRRPSFDLLGTNGQRDIVVVEVVRRTTRARDAAEVDVVRVEYWPESWGARAS